MHDLLTLCLSEYLKFHFGVRWAIYHILFAIFNQIPTHRSPIWNIQVSAAVNQMLWAGPACHSGSGYMPHIQNQQRDIYPAHCQLPKALKFICFLAFLSRLAYCFFFFSVSGRNFSLQFGCQGFSLRFYVDNIFNEVPLPFGLAGTKCQIKIIRTWQLPVCQSYNPPNIPHPFWRKKSLWVAEICFISANFGAFHATYFLRFIKATNPIRQPQKFPSEFVFPSTKINWKWNRTWTATWTLGGQRLSI